MKILVIPSWYPSDNGGFFKEHADLVANKDVEIDILVCDIVGIRDSMSYNDKKSDIDSHFVKVIRHRFYKIPKFEKLNYLLWCFFVFLLTNQYIKKSGKPDIIHVHSCWWGGYAAYKIFKKFKIPYIITEHRGRFVNNNVNSDNLIKNWHKPYISKAINNSKKVVVVSESLIPKIQKLSGCDLSKFILIPNVVNTDFFVQKGENKSDKGIQLFCLGNHEFVKGIDILIHAIALLDINIRNKVMLNIGGSGILTESYKKLVIQLYVEKQITFVGQLSRFAVREFMQQSDIFVLPSRFEAFGVVFIEALSTGIPLIGTRSGGPSSIINDTNGILIDTENSEQLARAIEYMFKNHTLYKSENLHKEALNKYSYNVIRDKYHALYKSLVLCE